MRKVDSDGVERIDVRFPTDCLEDMNVVGVLLNAGKDAEAFAQMQARRTKFAHAFGAVNYWADQPSNAVGAGLPAPEVLRDWIQTVVDANGNITAAEREGSVTSRRRVACAAGKTYSVRFTVQPPGAHGYVDAFPMVRPSLAIVPAGSGLSVMTVTDAPTALAVPEGGSAGGANMVSVSGEDLPALYGKTKFVNFLIVVASDVFLDFVLPTPRA